MNVEAINPAFGWLALLSLPAIGYRLHGSEGMNIGMALAGLLAAGPLLVNTDSISSAEYLSACGYLVAFSLVGSLLALALSPILLPVAFPVLTLAVAFGSPGPENETLGLVLLFLGSTALACTVQAYAMLRYGVRAMLIVAGIEAVFFSGFWALRSRFMRMEVRDGEGYDGLFELTAYMNSITTCALFAVGLCIYRQLRPHSSHSVRPC